jgi:hypothetical protein
MIEENHDEEANNVESHQTLDCLYIYYPRLWNNGSGLLRNPEEHCVSYDRIVSGDSKVKSRESGR